MIRLNLSQSTENFRTEFATWLNQHTPPKLGSSAGLEAFQNAGRTWQRQLADSSWVGVHWPKEFGGRGLSLVEEAIVQEELVRVASPQLLGLFGLTMVGPVLIEYGTQQQKERYLKNILSAKEIWCQGFSEPAAGSDLAAIKTKAVKSKDGYYLSGQKIWTSFAHIAEMCFVLARTSEGEKKHDGLSYLLVDMKSKGISTRPLKQISGDDEFNEVFFDQVFVPNENLVGQEGQGWKIAISTLMYERVVLTFSRQLQSEVALRGLLKQFGDSRDPYIREQIAAEVARASAVRALAYEHLLDYSEGKKPGPEGSLDKLFWSESFQAISKLALKLRGTEAALSEENPLVAHDVHRYLYSRGRTIAAGTSEIQRNIIAQRILGL